MATKSDVADMATKANFNEVKTDILVLKTEIKAVEYRMIAELNDKLRIQSMALLGGMTAIVGLATAIIKFGS